MTVWLALKQPTTVTLSVMASQTFGAPSVFSTTPIPSNPRHTVAIGLNLHIVAVTAHAAPGDKPLEAGKEYFYNVTFLTDTNSITLLGAVGNDATLYAYPGRTQPSFVMPPTDINKLRLIQGSCRKPNAGGPDALATLDRLIAGAIADPTITRPHQLILGGDQIYADEVADVLLLMLSDAAVALLGTPETMPLVDGAIVAETVRPTTRTGVIVDHAKLTSDDTRSHLMSLGEYLAMYLFVWSDVLWPKDLDNDIPVMDDLAKAGVNVGGLSKKVRGEIPEQRKGVVTMAKTLKSVRRALANIPTYMILDDHEVTDDYNMTREFCENVYGSPLGMRIIRNGLTAYALCQHWGNAPEQFETNAALPFNPPAGVAFLQSFATAAANPGAFDTAVKQAVGLHTPAEMLARSQKTGLPFAVYHDEGLRAKTPDGWVDSSSLIFNYSVETPAYQLIVTDSRTGRSFPRGLLQPPDLIEASQLAFQIGGTPDLANRLLMVLFTTNFPACPGIRQAARDLPTLGRGQIYENDLFDSWEIERVDYGRILAALSRKFPRDANGVLTGSLVVLSGDVHASSVSRLHYKADAQTGDPAGGATRADLVIGQLISSALRNQSDKTLGEHQQGYSFVPDKLAAKLAKQNTQLVEDFIGWNPLTTAPGTRVADRQESYLSLTDTTKSHAETVPWRVTNDGTIVTQRIETQIELTLELLVRQIINVVQPPDFRMHLEYVQGDPSGLNGYVPPPIDKTSAMKRLRDSAMVCQAYSTNVRCAQEIVGMNNIVEVAFTADPSFPAKQVHQTVRWFDRGVDQQMTFNVSLLASNDIAKYPGEK
ncbi:MAG TPA: hypothetical protein VMB21_18390 [Candidatus Limnocylindria bacterium]|nr:hypothetical protein [Candidatus Limnocylindria bacterium]